jgi:hypothetical protein
MWAGADSEDRTIKSLLCMYGTPVIKLIWGRRENGIFSNAKTEEVHIKEFI